MLYVLTVKLIKTVFNSCWRASSVKLTESELREEIRSIDKHIQMKATCFVAARDVTDKHSSQVLELLSRRHSGDAPKMQRNIC